MAAKKVDGVELANEIMLKDLEGFLVKKKFYTDNSNKPLPQADQAKKAKFDISKRGKLRKVLDEKEIKTRFAYVRKAGIPLFSVTDHDSVNGCRMIRDSLRGGDPHFIAGAEFSCRDEEGFYHPAP